MKTRYFALVMGLVFLAIGILGFVPALKTAPTGLPPLAVDNEYGLLLGMFAVNVLHNVVHVLFGIWGVMAYTSYTSARWYAGSVAAIYAVLAVMGFVPFLNTAWGLVPLFGNNIWLHAAIAVVAAVFALMKAPARATAGFR